MDHLEHKIFVAGHRGLVGRALVKCLKSKGHHNLLLKTHQELDLTQRDQVEQFFAENRPDWVFLAAARVGGIVANSRFPVEFLLENLKIQNNVIELSHHYKVKKLLFLGSSCIYPREAPSPIREESLLSSPLENTNEAYALAKITGLKLARAYQQEYGDSFFSVMPCNLFGPGDNYHLEHSHVIPALIRKMDLAKRSDAKSVELWGTGEPRREFLYSEDLAEACLYLMEEVEVKEIGEIINIGSGSDLTIYELAHLVANIVGFHGEIVFNPNYPNGTMRKLLDSSRIEKLGWKAKTSLADGLQKAYHDYLQHLTNLKEI